MLPVILWRRNGGVNLISLSRNDRVLGNSILYLVRSSPLMICDTALFVETSMGIGKSLCLVSGVSTKPGCMVLRVKPSLRRSAAMHSINCVIAAFDAL